MLNMLKRLTTDNPQSNTEMLLNVAYAKDGRACDAKEEDIELNEIVEGIPLDRLCEICEAEREQRCVVLPCKVERIKEAVQGIYESYGCPYCDIGLSHGYGDCRKGCFQCIVDGLHAEAALQEGGQEE